MELVSGRLPRTDRCVPTTRELRSNQARADKASRVYLAAETVLPREEAGFYQVRSFFESTGNDDRGALEEKEEAK